MIAYIAIITTSRITASQALDLYRARCQIELHFKRDKFLGELDKLPSLIPKTIHAWKYGKILLNLIVQRLTAGKVNVSPSSLADIILRALLANAVNGPQPRALVRHTAGLDDGASRSPIHYAA